MTIKEKHQDTLIGQYLDLVKKVNYHNESIAPRYSEMEKFEIKEYEAVNSDNLKAIEDCKSNMMQNEQLFNQLLSEYNTSVVVFICKNSVN